MTDAQTVVDIFAPFVGTEGLRGIVSIRANKVDPLAVVIIDDRYGDRSIPYDIAHGFLLSRLAEGLAKRGYYVTGGCVSWRYTDRHHVHPPIAADDYPSAILAAARVEWPKREPAEPDEIPVTVEIAGKRFNLVAREAQLVAAIREHGIDGVMRRIERAVSE